jgi:hypothetical protein
MTKRMKAYIKYNLIKNLRSSLAKEIKSKSYKASESRSQFLGNAKIRGTI